MIMETKGKKKTPFASNEYAKYKRMVHRETIAKHKKTNDKFNAFGRYLIANKDNPKPLTDKEVNELITKYKDFGKGGI